MRKNEYSSVGGSELSKLVKESKLFERLPWIDKKLVKKAIEASRRRAQSK